MNLVERVKNILVNPDAEWLVIENEPVDARDLFLRYVAILALIPAVAGFVGSSVIGFSVSVGTFRVPLLNGIVNMIVSYILSFVLVYVVALLIDVLAGGFRGRSNFPNALKLSAYSFTPSWLAGIFLLVPGLRFLTILGLYGLYLLWTGLSPLMEAPRDKSLFYAVAVVIGAIVAMVVLGYIQGMVVPA